MPGRMSAHESPSPEQRVHTLGPRGIVRPRPLAVDAKLRWIFNRGWKRPVGVAWFGVRSFWGHLQHFVASAIATEDIDSRDWMHADPPGRLCQEIVQHLVGEELAKQPEAEASITAGIRRDLWIDFLADTGDDVSVSEAVGELFTTEYELPDPEAPAKFLLAPRGDILLMGGDVAYPVATANEIHDRVVVPFNHALARKRDGKRRVLLGIPGNHDWYDGLDGFARMFRRRSGELSPDAIEPSLTPARESRFEHVVDFVEQFVVGGRVTKRKTLVLDGYVPLQHASYFGVPLAPGIDLFAVDRQLRSIDFRQRKYFSGWRSTHADRKLFVVLPDPVYAFYEPSPTGVPMAQALELDLEKEPHLVLSGDIHHYERRDVGASTHVVAGGGGAFLHPARIPRRGIKAPEMEWPGVEQSKVLLRQVPWQIAAGRAGFIPHLLLLLFFAPALGVGLRFWGTQGSVTGASLVGGVFAAIVCGLIGGMQKKLTWHVVVLASLAGIAMGLVPSIVSLAFQKALVFVGLHPGPGPYAALVLLLAVFFGAFTFGAYLAALTWIGQESTQAFTALGHPGFKHFLRIRVRKDGSAIDAWCIGLANPLGKNERPVVVDQFTWRPQNEV